MGKKSEIMKFGLTLTLPAKFLGEAPKILKPVSGTPYQGLLPEKVWTMPLTLRGT